MSDIRNLQILAGIQLNETAMVQHNYSFLIVDPNDGHFTEYYRGSIIQILKQLQNDPENSMIADVIKSKNFGEMDNDNGKLSFKHDDHLYLFVPV